MHRTSIRHSVTDSQFSYLRSVHRSRSPVRGRQTTVIEHSPVRTYDVRGYSPVRSYGVVDVDHSYSPVRTYGRSHVTYNHSPLRAVTTTRNLTGAIATNVVHHHSPARVPLGRTDHIADRIGDSLVSYGVNDFGEEVRVTSTGIINGPAIRTLAEKVSPPRTHVSSHVTTGYGGFPLAHSTTVHGTSPSRHVKETVYGAHRIGHPTGYIAREYSPVRGGITRIDHSPVRSVTRVDHSPLRSSYTRVAHHHHIEHSPVRIDHSPVRSVTRVDHSPVRRSYGYVEPVATRVEHAPVTTITAGPLRRSISRSISPARVHHHYDLGVVGGPTVRHYDSPSRRVSYSKTVVESNSSMIHHSRHLY